LLALNVHEFAVGQHQRRDTTVLSVSVSDGQDADREAVSVGKAAAMNMQYPCMY
jgi:hypothetical protein